MNDELIPLNELLNSGQRIYFYQEAISDVWSAWGYSAYLLSHMEGIKCLTGFSDKMQMPYACITAIDLKGIARENMDIIAYKDGFCLLPVKERVEADAYQKWVASLK